MRLGYNIFDLRAAVVTCFLLHVFVKTNWQGRFRPLQFWVSLIFPIMSSLKLMSVLLKTAHNFGRDREISMVFSFSGYCKGFLGLGGQARPFRQSLEVR